MSVPSIFIATNRLKPGKLADERKRVPGLVDFVEANEPRLIAFNEYVNEDGTEVAVVQVQPGPACGSGSSPATSAASRADLNTAPHVHLAFVPTRWSVTIVGSATSIPLPAARTATWLARHGGILDVDARGRVGSASYLVRIVLR